jgi:hypothetical protein
MRLRSAVILLPLLLAGCGPSLPPTRVAVGRRQLPPVLEDKALVIFMFPPCARYSGPVATEEERLLCRARRRNRIRIVEQGARLVSDFGVDQYGASYEEPGRHLYGAYHHFDHCIWYRTDCVAALKANLMPGQIYFVTFRWDHILTGGGKGPGGTYGRLQITPVSAERETIFRARLAEIDRVEPTPGYREPGPIIGLRSSYVSRLALDRLAQDRREGAPIPHLGGRVTVEEIKKEEELPKEQAPSESVAQ